MTDNPALRTVEQYIEFWNTRSDDERLELAEKTFADQVAHYTPLGVFRGVDQLIGFRNQFAEHSPGYEFRTRAEVQSHHDRARVRWELMVDGTSFATGTDVLELDDTGRVHAISGFLDRAPEGFDHADH
jgi:hypothetical protein